MKKALWWYCDLQRFLLFLGAIVCLYRGFSAGLSFSPACAPEGVEVMTDINEYLDFVMSMFVAFGLSFEVPVVVVLLARLGIVKVAQLKKARPYVIIGAFFIGAMITPPDVISQLLLALPLWLLFEIGVLFAGYLGRKEALTSKEDISS